MVNRDRDTVLNCTMGGLLTNEPAGLGIENQHVQLKNFVELTSKKILIL